MLMAAGVGLAGGVRLAGEVRPVGMDAGRRVVPDDLGRSVSVVRTPLRIVSLSPGATEMLFSAGGGAQLVGTVQYSDEPPAARTVPRIGDAVAIDMERLVALRPDVVLVSPALGNPAQLAKIRALGVPLYQQQVMRLADLPASVRRLGALTGTGPEAEREARELQARLAALEHDNSGRGMAGAAGAAGAADTGGAARSRSGVRRPSVLLQVWNRPIYTIGGRHLMSDALSLCGARNVFADLPEPSPLVDIEAVIARDPDIILAAAPAGEAAAWVADWQRFPSLTAVRSGRVLEFEDQALSRMGPSVIDATEKLCRTIARLSRGSY